MKRMNGRAPKLICVVSLLAITAIMLSGRKPNVQAEKKNIVTEPPEQFVPGRVLVKFHDNILPAHARNIIAALGARDASEIPNIGVHILDLPYQANERAFVRSFQARSEVEFAELDRILEPGAIAPNDPWYPNQWSLAKIGAPTAWATTTGAADVTIAILDTGVDGSHPDLASKMVPGWNVYDNNSNTSDVVGHGTMVAGTAAAISNNGQGVASVAWGCSIMPIRISDLNGNATYSAAASGLNWAADHGAKVANISYIMTDSSAVTSSARYFQSKGGVVTVSSGNSSTYDASADNPYVLTVGATNGDDVIYPWSNTGNNVDLVAPGFVYTTVRGGLYSTASGTSVAAPTVAGVVALVISANPSLTPAEVQNVLKQSADDLGASGWDSSYGWGRVNAARAVCAATGGLCPSPTPTPMATPTPTPVPSPSPSPSPSGSPTPTPTPLPTPTPSPSPILDTTPPSVGITSPSTGAKVLQNLSVLVTTADNVAVTRVELYVDGVLTATSNAAPFTTKWTTKKAASGAHSLQCKAYDAAGNGGNSTLVTVYK